MAEIRTIMLDLETFSSVDLLKCGVYRYASSPDFDILLFDWNFCIDGTGFGVTVHIEFYHQIHFLSRYSLYI